MGFFRCPHRLLIFIIFSSVWWRWMFEQWETPIKWHYSEMKTQAESEREREKVQMSVSWSNKPICADLGNRWRQVSAPVEEPQQRWQGRWQHFQRLFYWKTPLQNSSCNFTFFMLEVKEEIERAYKRDTDIIYTEWGLINFYILFLSL